MSGLIDGTAEDPLVRLMAGVAAGDYPDADGGFTVVPPDRTTGLHGVFSFTGHAVVATDRSREEVAALGVDGLGGAETPEALRGLAGPDGFVGVLDVVLWRRGTGTGPARLVETSAWDEHPRVTYARALRREVRVLAGDDALVTLGRGIGRRWELGVELLAGPHAAGRGRAVVAEAVAATPEGTPLFASCAPGNARSLRALLACGFQPVGGEVLLRPPGAGGVPHGG